MKKFLLCMFLCFGIVGVNMASERSHNTDISFLSRIKKNKAWLEQQLGGAGISSSRFAFKGNEFFAKDLHVIIFVNRIRTFSTIGDGMANPYFHLVLEDSEGKKVDCVTSEPTEIVKTIKFSDFNKDAILVSKLDLPKIRECQVKEDKKAIFVNLPVEKFRSKFFGKFGELQIEKFAYLDKNPQFILTAINHGHYAFIGDLTGYLGISL